MPTWQGLIGLPPHGAHLNGPGKSLSLLYDDRLQQEYRSSLLYER